MASRLVLGLDLGTSALKAVVTDVQGEVLASAGWPLTTRSRLPGEAEQEPGQWLEAVRCACGALDATAAAGPDWRTRVAGVGLAGQLPTLVRLGDHGTVGNAITWKDSRADAAAAQVIRDRRRVLYEQTGMPIDGRYLAPMLRFHRHAHPEPVRGVLSAKDYLCYALTGLKVTDPSTAAGYGLYDLSSGAFAPGLCELWSVPADFLPAIRPAHSTAGPLTPAGATLLGLRPGLPVTVGAADSVASAYAMTGLGEQGRACIIMGSSAVILDTVHKRVLDERMRYLLTPHVEPDWYAREMDLLATGTGHRWLAELLGLSDEALVQAAAGSAPGANGLLFTPYLAGGEQGALWNPSLRGSITGLTLQSRREDLARAFLEGMGYEMRRCIDVLGETHPVREVVLAGHLAASDFGRQLLADILGRSVQAFPSVSPAALGAAYGALRCLDTTLAPRLPSLPPCTGPGADRETCERGYARYLRHT